MEQLGILVSASTDEIIASQCIEECNPIVDCPEETDDDDAVDHDDDDDDDDDD